MKIPKQRKNKVAISLRVLIVVAVLSLAAVYVYGRIAEEPPAPIADQKTLEVTKSPIIKKESTLKSVSEVPARIIIEKIGVDAAIEPVGLTEGGFMDAPNSNETVGWYEESSRAGGDEFAMLLDGHYGTDAQAAVFRHLEDLVVGDVITIEGDKGTLLEYTLRETRQQRAEDVDMKRALFPYKEGSQSLTIITCEGLFDAETVTYDKRTIIYAERTA